MGKYASEHGSALADVTEAGTSVTFTRGTGTYDEATGLVTPGSTSITGSAIQVQGDPDTYKALTLIESSAPTLFFTPGTYGDLPSEGDKVTWAGAVHTVRDVAPLRPDGVAIAARVVIAR